MDKAEVRRELFSVHVGNVPRHISEEVITKLFEQAGNVQSVFLQASTGTFTYAFVRYKTLEEAEKACKMFHKYYLDGMKIFSSLAEDTRCRRSSSEETKTGRSISRNRMSQMEGNKYTVSSSDYAKLNNQLKQSLNCLYQDDAFTQFLNIHNNDDRQLFMKDFKNSLVEMADKPVSIGVEPITFTEKCIDRSALKELILRYHDPCETAQRFKEIDIDICGKSSLSKEQVDKYFSFLPWKGSVNSSFEGNISICNFDEFCKISKKSVDAPH